MKYQNLIFNPVERLSIFYPYVFADNILSQKECEEIILSCKKEKLSRGTVGQQTSYIENEKIRKSNVIFIRPLADNIWLFEKLGHMISSINDLYYNFVLNGFNGIQFTEYTDNEKGFYDWHMDCAMGVPDPEMQAMRKLSISILLNEDYEGGAMQFNAGSQENPLEAETKLGRAILFPSFMPHRVAPVTKGNRYSLVIWVYGPKFA